MDGNGQDSELVVERAAVPTPLEVQLDSQKAIARIGAIAQVIDGCAKASIQRTNAADWVRNGVKVEAIIGVDYAKGAEGGGNPAVISEAQAKRFYAISSGARVANETV